MFYLLSFIVFSFQLSPFSFQFNKFSAFISPICISRASACALTQNRLQRYNKIPTYANLTAFFLRFVCFFVHFPFFPSFPFPIPPIPRPSPFPPSLLQYGGWPLFIYAWDVIPRSFLLSISPVPLHSPSHSHSPLSIPPVPPSVWWLASVYICVGCYPAPIPHPIPPRPSPSHSHPCIPPIPPPVLSIPSFFFYAGYYPPSLPCGEGRGEAIYLSGLYVASSFAKIA